MVGVMALRSRENAASLLNSAKVAMAIPAKLQHLSQFNREFSHADPALLSEFLPQLLDLLSDRFSPVRKLVIEVIGEIGLQDIQFLHDIMPALIAVLQDGTPAVARQAITSGTNLFRSTLAKVAIQDLSSSGLEESVESSWEWMQKFKEKLYSLAFQPGSDGIKLPALRFIEAIILLYTPDPNGSSEPPTYQAFEENLVEFNISWLRGGHPLLNIGDLSIEASQSLGLLLDQLRFITMKSPSSSIIIVLINSLAAIANKRPAFYGRILPVLLGLDPSRSSIKGMHLFAVRHAIKNAFLSSLKCSHPGAAPWRDRIIGALKQIEAGSFVREDLPSISNTNGSMEDGKDDLPHSEEEKPSVVVSDALKGSTSRKRSGVQETSELMDDNGSGKRVRSSSIDSEDSSKDLRVNAAAVQVETPSTGHSNSQGDRINGPVQQLVAMFGALVAQGEKAAASLEILVSSISSDLLADVVMANLRNFPKKCPYGEEEKILLNTGSHASTSGNNAQNRLSSSCLADILTLLKILHRKNSILDAQSSASTVVLKTPKEEVDDAPNEVNNDKLPVGITVENEEGSLVSVSVTRDEVLPLKTEEDDLTVPSEIHHTGNLGNEIPGLDTEDGSNHMDSKAQQITSSFGFMDTEDGSHDQASSADRMSVEDQLPSLSTDRSEEMSQKTSVSDITPVISSTATSVRMSNQIVLPKMSAPVVDLADEQKDHIQRLAFARIIETYKRIAVAGGLHVRLSLLAFIGVEFSLDLDPWKLLQKHIMSDYMNHEGHELTLRVLYRLFGEAEDQDFFSSANATSIYEMFLLAVAEALRDSLPASDKSLVKLLGEVPYLPKSIFKLLECLCSPVKIEKDENGVRYGDRVTQGLSAVWSLILLRPTIRDDCLTIALQSAVHPLEEVRMKAIRLVANKLYPISSITQRIEDFAKEMLVSKTDGGLTIDRVDADGDSNMDKPVEEPTSTSDCNKDVSCETHSSTSSSVSEAQRWMSLYFALCTKKHSLFREIFVMYKSTSKTVRQAVDCHIPILVRTMGSSPELLDIISDPPPGSNNLLMQVLHTLTDNTVPSQALMVSVKILYESQLKDVEVLMPILPFLPKEEVIRYFPSIVNLPLEKFQAALTRSVQGSSQSGPVLTPAEVLIAIHGIDPERDGIPLKKVTDACNACFQQRQIFTQQVLAKVLNHLVEQIPLPLLFMRTVIQAIGVFPALVDFMMEILSRLVSKQIWKLPKLWVGFLKCVFLTRPQSFSVLLQLPPPQLESALVKNSALKAPLIAHASQPDIRSSLPRSVLAVLGIGLDSQTSNQAQTSQDLDTSNSGKELVKESESSGAS